MNKGRERRKEGKSGEDAEYPKKPFTRDVSKATTTGESLIS